MHRLELSEFNHGSHLCFSVQDYQEHHSEDEDGDLYEKIANVELEDRPGGGIDKPAGGIDKPAGGVDKRKRRFT